MHARQSVGGEAHLVQRVDGRRLLHILHSLWLWRKHPHERGQERRVLELESFTDCECALRGHWGLGCSCGFGLRGYDLIGTLSFGFRSYGPLLLVLLSLSAIWHLQARRLAVRHLQAIVFAALLVEMATTALEDQGEDKSDDDADDDADDDPNRAARLNCQRRQTRRRRWRRWRWDWRWRRRRRGWR